MKKFIFFSLFTSLLILGLYLRFYNFPQRVSLEADSSRDAFVAFEGASKKQFPLVGPFTSVAPVVSSPWYWIELIFAAGLFPTPYAPWILIGIYSFLTILVVYKCGEILGGKWLGLFIALIACLSPQLISDATNLNNHSIITFFSSLTIYFFLKLLRDGPKKHLALLFGLMIGLTISAHYQAVGLLTLPLSLLFFRKKYLKMLAYAFATMFIVLLPLLIFEFLNHWYNTRNIIRYLLVDQYKIWVPKRWLTYITDGPPSYPFPSVFRKLEDGLSWFP